MRFRDVNYLFSSLFDDEADEYQISYSIREMPELTDEQVRGSWTDFEKLSIRIVGSVPVSKVLFDRSKRESIDESVLKLLLP